MTDYCRGDQEHCDQFKTYVKQRDYKFLTVKVCYLNNRFKCFSVCAIYQFYQDYSKTLERAGFGNVVAIDKTENCIDILKTELAGYEQNKADVLRQFTEDDYNIICRGWRDKIVRCDDGDLAWGYFKAQKMFD